MVKNIKLGKVARRNILLKLAQRIEAKPELYNFLGHGDLTTRDASCPLQYIANVLRLKATDGETALTRAAKALGFEDESDFYKAADVLLADMQGLDRHNPRRMWLLHKRGSLFHRPTEGSTTTQIAMAMRLMAHAG